jgi:hypothetical protein
MREKVRWSVVRQNITYDKAALGVTAITFAPSWAGWGSEICCGRGLQAQGSGARDPP